MEDLSGGAQHLGRPEAAAEADPVPLAHISEADQQHLEAFPLACLKWMNAFCPT